MIITKFSHWKWNRGTHVHGDCSVNHEHKLVYVNIPKCGTSWFKTYLEQQKNWLGEDFLTTNFVDYKKIIVLRDPLERWVSACPARGYNYVLTDTYDDPIIGPDGVMCDEHANPQCNFLVGLDLTNSVFFWCDDNLTQNVNDFMTNQGLPVIDKLGMINTSAGDAELVADQLEVRRILNIPEVNARFRRWYSDDYKLISSVKFYASNI